MSGGVGCVCGWPIDSCNPQFAKGQRCDKRRFEKATRTAPATPHLRGSLAERTGADGLRDCPTCGGDGYLPNAQSGKPELCPNCGGERRVKQQGIQL